MKPGKYQVVSEFASRATNISEFVVKDHAEEFFLNSKHGSIRGALRPRSVSLEKYDRKAKSWKVLRRVEYAGVPVS